MRRSPAPDGWSWHRSPRTLCGARHRRPGQRDRHRYGPEHRRDGFTFEADLLSHGGIDLSLKLRLTERVVVREGAGDALLAEHCAEPPGNVQPVEVTQWTLVAGGELIASWPAITP
ncbi:phage tail protein [Chitiniphilus shinanonensis]|uniref:phage tail protein n=1 Tax=Chitiniphilus shinanonensis TaxID=553088 RepID=UPI0012F82FF6|nr:phage tail protein [Chitiniphilus shinanonensis]